MRDSSRGRVRLSMTGLLLCLAIAGLGSASAQDTASPTPAGLRLIQFGAAESAFHVVSTLIAGETESILWDAQYKVSDGVRLAERIAATGTRLKAIVLSHADHDHYMGALEVVRRFPGTPVYMTPGGLADFRERSAADLAAEKRQPNPEAPDSLVSPEALGSLVLSVDGQEIQVIQGLTGDVKRPVSSALWIPSLRAILAADLVFDGIHPWLGGSDVASRTQWRASLERLVDMEPEIVVAGHKREIDALDSPTSLSFMIDYLSDFDRLLEASSTPRELVESMLIEYPDLTLPVLMVSGARAAFSGPGR